MKTLIAVSAQQFPLPTAGRLSAILSATFLTGRLLLAAETTPAGEVATNPLLGAEVPVSVFVNDPNAGKDPFFPQSKRRQPVVKVTTAPSAPKAPVNHLSDLTLRGISGTPPKRIALINNLTFVAGEEGKVRVPGGQLKVRVVEVNDSSATIQIEGETINRELRLREGASLQLRDGTAEQLLLSQKPKAE